MRRSKRCIACSGFFFAEAPSPLNPSPFFSVYVYVLFLSVKEKEPSESSGTRLGWPAAPARQRRLPYPQKYLRGFSLKSPAGKNIKQMKGEGCPMEYIHPPPQ